MTRRGVKETETLKDQIAKATLRLVAERGSDAVARRDVIKAMGITRGAMARYCPSEEDLWLAVAALIERRMTQVWVTAAAGDMSPLARLRSLLAVQVGLIMETPGLRILLLSGSLHEENTVLREALRNVRQRFRTHLAEAITEGQRTGQFGDGLDAEVAAGRIIETLQGMVVSRSLGRQLGDPVEEIWDRIDVFLRRAANDPRAPLLDQDPA